MHVVVNGWFYHRPDTGSGQYLRRLLAHLAGQPGLHRLTVLVPSGAEPPATVSQAWPHAPDVAVQWHPLLRGVSRPVAKLWWEQITVPRQARLLGGQVLFVPYWAPPWWQPIPTVVTVHDLIPQLLPEYRGTLFHRLYTGLVARTTRRCAQVITVSQATARDVVACLGLPPSRVHPVHHGPNLEPGPPSAARQAEVRERYALPERYFLYLGGFDVRKNLAAVFRAYRRYLEMGGDPAVRLVVAGRLPEADTALFPDPRRLARAAGVAERVHFIGRVAEADKGALYHMAVAFLFPSRYEGFGMMVLEAMAAGCPVITAGADG